MSHMKLWALRYAKPQLDFNDETDVCDLITFLDHKYFHHGFAHDAGNVMELDEHLKQYITDVGLEYSNEIRSSLIDVLLNAAVTRNLREKLVGHAGDACQAANQLRLAKILESMNQEELAAFDELVRSKAAELKITSYPSTMRMAMAILSCNTEPSPENDSAFKLSEVPSGIKSTGDSKVDDALKILRMINVYRYRDLQTQVNEHLASLQEITADPKADTKIGRVGY
uniref:Uncharacterized protein n=1 Tax=Panagrolaimus superbus TaxID=310955 RepID=A0A914Z4B8_9BILA